MFIHLASLETHKIHLPFSCKNWTSTKIGMLEISENFDLTQTWRYKYYTPWAKEEKNRTPLFWVEVTFEWYEGTIVFYVFISVLCLETTVEESNWIKTTNDENWNYLIIVMIKVLSQQLRSTMSTELKDTLQLKILQTRINIGVELAQIHLTYYCMLLFLWNKPSF